MINITTNSPYEPLRRQLLDAFKVKFHENPGRVSYDDSVFAGLLAAFRIKDEAASADIIRTLLNLRIAIMHSDPQVLTCVLWMPEEITKGETVIDYIDNTLMSYGVQISDIYFPGDDTVKAAMETRDRTVAAFNDTKVKAALKPAVKVKAGSWSLIDEDEEWWCFIAPGHITFSAAVRKTSRGNIRIRHHDHGKNHWDNFPGSLDEAKAVIEEEFRAVVLSTLEGDQ